MATNEIPTTIKIVAWQCINKHGYCLGGRKPFAMIHLIETTRPEAVALTATGKVTIEHYQEVYPVIMGKINTYGRIPIMIRLEKLDSSAAKRLWNVIKQDAEQVDHFYKIAVVVDKMKYRLMLKMAMPLIPAEMKVFSIGEERAALKWLEQ